MKKITIVICFFVSVGSLSGQSYPIVGISEFTDVNGQSIDKFTVNVEPGHNSFSLNYKGLTIQISDVSKLISGINSTLDKVGAPFTVDSISGFNQINPIQSAGVFFFTFNNLPPGGKNEEIFLKLQTGKSCTIIRKKTPPLVITTSQSIAFFEEYISIYLSGTMEGYTYKLHREADEETTLLDTKLASDNTLIFSGNYGYGKFWLSYGKSEQFVSNYVYINCIWPYRHFEQSSNEIINFTNEGFARTITLKPAIDPKTYDMNTFGRLISSYRNGEVSYWDPQIYIQYSGLTNRNEIQLLVYCLPNTGQKIVNYTKLFWNDETPITQEGGWFIKPYEMTIDTVSQGSHYFKIELKDRQMHVNYILYHNNIPIKSIPYTSDLAKEKIVFDNLCEPGMYTVRGIYRDIEKNMIGSYTRKNTKYTHNFIKETTYISADGKKEEMINYYDGLNRIIQNLIIRDSISGNDIVNIIEYDRMGRNDSISYLPFISTINNNGNFVYNPLTQQETYYSAKFTGDSDCNYAYSRKEYVSGTTTKVYGPGESGAANPVQYDSYLNDGSENLKKFAKYMTKN